MGMAAADGTGIGFDSPVIQTDTTEDVRVGLVHVVVCFVKRSFITVEGIASFMMNSRPRSSPKRGLNSSRNFVCIWKRVSGSFLYLLSSSLRRAVMIS